MPGVDYVADVAADFCLRILAADFAADFTVESVADSAAFLLARTPRTQRTNKSTADSTAVSTGDFDRRISQIGHPCQVAVCQVSSSKSPLPSVAFGCFVLRSGAAGGLVVLLAACCFRKFRT